MSALTTDAPTQLSPHNYPPSVNSSQLPPSASDGSANGDPPGTPTPIVPQKGDHNPSDPEKAASAAPGILGGRLTRRAWIAIFVLAGVVCLALILTLCLVFLLPKHHRPEDDLGGPEQDFPTNNPNEASYPSPSPMVGTRPFNSGEATGERTIDPSVTRRTSDGKLFLFTTGLGEGHNKVGNGSLWTSEGSMSGPWTRDVDGLDKYNGALGQPGGGPQVTEVDGMYYMYFNSHDFEYEDHGVDNPDAQNYYHDASIVVRQSKTMELGSWETKGRIGVPWQAKYNILDASMISVNSTETDGSGDDDGKGSGMRNLLSFGSYQTGIYQVQLGVPPTRVADGAIDDMTHLEMNTTARGPRGQTEAAFQFEYEDWHYLFFSSGRCCPKHGKWVAREDVYRIMVCRSRNPRGDFVDKDGRSCVDDNGGTQILASHGGIWAPGGQGVFLDRDGAAEGQSVGPILYYHYVVFDEEAGRPKPGFTFGWNKLSFHEGWPTVI